MHSPRPKSDLDPGQDSKSDFKPNPTPVSLQDSDRVMCDKAQTTLQSYAALDPDKFTQCVGTFMQRGTTSAMDRCNQLLSHARCLQAKEQMGS